MGRSSWLRGATLVAAASALCVGGTLGVAHAQTIQTVVVKGQVAPLPGSIYRGFRRPEANDAALRALVFRAKIRGATGGSRGIFIEDPLGGGLTVVQSNDLTPDGFLFKKFSRPAANVLGDTVYQAKASGSERGIWGNGPTDVNTVGDPMPIGFSGVLDKFSRPRSAANGDVIFHATISGAATIAGVIADEAILRCSGGNRDCSSGTGTGTLEVLVLKTDAVPDRVGRLICDVSDELGVSSWGIAFRADTKLDCSDDLEIPLTGVFRMQFLGVIETLAMQTEQSQPDLAPGGTLYGTLEGKPAIENDGIVAFRGRTSGVINSEFIFGCDPVQCPGVPADALVQQGMTDGAGGMVSRFAALGISDVGDITFSARVGGLGRGQAIYVRRDATGSLERIVGRGDLVPDQVTTTFFRRVHLPTTSPAGRIAWRARMKRQIGGSADALFLFD